MPVKVWLNKDPDDPNSETDTLTVKKANDAQIAQGHLLLLRTEMGSFNKPLGSIVAGRWWRWEILEEKPEHPEPVKETPPAEEPAEEPVEETPVVELPVQEPAPQKEKPTSSPGTPLKRDSRDFRDFTAGS